MNAKNKKLTLFHKLLENKDHLTDKVETIKMKEEMIEKLNKALEKLSTDANERIYSQVISQKQNQVVNPTIPKSIVQKQKNY